LLRQSRKAIWIWVALSAPAILLTLHAAAILPLARQTVRLDHIQHHQGLAYVAEFPAPYPARFETDAHLLEDGRALPFPNMWRWESVARDGGGRYRVELGKVYFSASDNSDPRTNGKAYTLNQPWPLPRWLMWMSWSLMVAATLWLIAAAGGVVLGAAAKPRFAYVAAAFVLVFAANRAWLFVDYPVAAIHPDSGGYYGAAEQIMSGTWPNFGNRPPVYPLLLAGVFAIDDRAIAIVAVQTALSLVAGLLMTYAVFRWRRSLTIPAAIVMILFLCGLTTIEHDTAMLSESVYTSFLVLAFASLLLALPAGAKAWLTASSAFMGLAILTRPAGMFLLVVYLFVVLWLAWQRSSWKAVIAFGLPLPLLMLAISTYNARKVGVFAPTTWGEANFAVATQLSWQPDDAYPPEINAAIQKIHDIIYGRMAAIGKDPSVLDTSWDSNALAPIFVESFNQAALDVALTMGGQYETGARPWIRRIGLDTIRKRPARYARFVWTMLALYFQPESQFDFRGYLMNRSDRAYVQRVFAAGDPFMARLGKEYTHGEPPTGIVIANRDASGNLADRIVVVPTRLWRLYDMTRRVREIVFDRRIWLLGFLAALAISMLCIVKAIGDRTAAFAVFIIAISAVGASLVVSLVEFSQPRYSTPMSWAPPLVVVLLPLIVRSKGGHDV